jgi:hypothetical protein
MDSNRAVSFFIHLRNFQDAGNVHPDPLENYQTKERLVIRTDQQPFRHVAISRHPVQAKEEWIKEMGEITNMEYRFIVVQI